MAIAISGDRRCAKWRRRVRCRMPRLIGLSSTISVRKPPVSAEENDSRVCGEKDALTGDGDKSSATIDCLRPCTGTGLHGGVMGVRGIFDATKESASGWTLAERVDSRVSTCVVIEQENI